jgi:outer membrane lipoprotein-sorting protein
MSRQNFFTNLSFIVCLISILQGCASHRPDTNPILDKQALHLSKQTKSFNEHITTGKGTAWATLETDTKHEKFKIAWAVVFPNKIRITFLISANPIETIIATGEKITFISHTGQHSRHSYKSKDPDMEKYIHVPIKMSEMILILLGRFPVKEFDDAYFAPWDPSLSTIVLKQKWRDTKQHLHYNDKQNIDSICLEDYTGQPVYKTMTIEYKKYGSDNIPAILEIKDNDNRKLTLEIINFIANPTIRESIFKLTEDGS